MHEEPRIQAAVDDPSAPPWLPWLAAGLFLAALFCPVMLHPGDLPLIGGPGEGTRQVLPVYEQIHRAGRPVFWDPHLFSGHPLFANSQLAPLYPPTWVAAILLQPGTCYWVLMLLHVALGLAGWYLLIADHGVWRLLAMGGSMILARQELLVSQQFAYPLCWWPWVWLASRRVLLGPASRRRVAGLGGSMALALMLSCGHPQIIAYALLITLVVVASCWWSARRRCSGGRGSAAKTPGAGDAPAGAEGWLLLLGGALLALLLAAFQLLPLLELSNHSHRVAMLSDWFATKSPLVENPEIFGGMRIIFGSWRSPLLFFWAGALAALAWAGRRSPLACLVVVIVLAALYALGDITPVIFLLQKVIPLLDHFRNPHQVVTHLHFLVVLLGCLGWQALQEESGARALRRGWWRVLLAVALLTIAWALASCCPGLVMRLGRGLYALLGRGASFQERRQEILKALEVVRAGCGHGALVLALGGALAVPALRNARVARIAMRLGLLGCICLALAAVPISTIPRQRLLPRNSLVRWLLPRLHQDGGPYRVLNLRVAFTRIIEQPMAVHYGIHVADGMDPLIPMSYWQSWLQAVSYDKEPYPSTKLPVCNLAPDQIRDLDVLRRWNVRYILSTVAADRRGLRLARHFRQVPTFMFGRGRGVYPDVYVYELEPPPPGLLSPLPPASPAAVRILTLALGVEEVRAQVFASAPLTLALSVCDYPAWQVSLDGRVCPKDNAGAGRPAVRLAPGLHTVRFFIRARSLEYGLLLTLAGLLAWGTLLALAPGDQRGPGRTT